MVSRYYSGPGGYGFSCRGLLVDNSDRVVGLCVEMMHWLSWDNGKLWAVAGGIFLKIPLLAERLSLVL